jgi:hypothetical protein
MNELRIGMATSDRSFGSNLAAPDASVRRGLGVLSGRGYYTVQIVIYIICKFG